jgi:hypothetical protein
MNAVGGMSSTTLLGPGTSTQQFPSLPANLLKIADRMTEIDLCPIELLECAVDQKAPDSHESDMSVPVDGTGSY